MTDTATEEPDAMPAAAVKPSLPLVVYGCTECGSHPALARGADVAPDDETVRERNVYACTNVNCAAYVACLPDGIRPCGSPAGLALREARAALYTDVLKPLAKSLPVPSAQRSNLVHA